MNLHEIWILKDFFYRVLLGYKKKSLAVCDSNITAFDMTATA